MARAHYKVEKAPLKPVTTLRGKRLFAWLWAYLLASAAMACVLFPVLMASTDPELPFAAALQALFRENLFVVLLPGVFISILYLGPIWLVLRVWISRQKDRDLGYAPATVPVWITIWVLLTVVQILNRGDDGSIALPSAFSAVPDPFSNLFNGVILTKMAAVSLMLLVYRRTRPRDGRDRLR